MFGQGNGANQSGDTIVSRPRNSKPSGNRKARTGSTIGAPLFAATRTVVVIAWSSVGGAGTTVLEVGPKTGAASCTGTRAQERPRSDAAFADVAIAHTSTEPTGGWSGSGDVTTVSCGCVLAASAGSPTAEISRTWTASIRVPMPTSASKLLRSTTSTPKALTRTGSGRKDVPASTETWMSASTASPRSLTSIRSSWRPSGMLTSRSGTWTSSTVALASKVTFQSARPPALTLLGPTTAASITVVEGTSTGAASRRQVAGQSVSTDSPIEPVSDIATATG